MKTIAILLMLNLLLTSCNNYDSCGDLPNAQYDITSISAKATVSEPPFNSFGSPFTTTEFNTGQTVSVDQFILELNATTGPAFTSNNKITNPPFQFSLIPIAKACSPALPFTKEKISAIAITSSSDFSNEFPAGTDLKPLFLVIYNEPYLFDKSSGENKPYSLEEFVELNPSAGHLIQLNLSQSPDISKTHQFNIEYSHEDGEFFMMSLADITFE